VSQFNLLMTTGYVMHQQV